MKRSDIALLILIVAITLTISFIVVKSIFGEPQNQAVSVEKVQPLSSEIVQPQASVFNSNAINPTVVIQIGNPGSRDPFSDQ